MVGQPYEDLQTLYAMKGRLEETSEMAKTLGLGNGGEAGSIYQAIVQVRALVDSEIKAARNIVDPREDRQPYSPNALAVGVLRSPLAASCIEHRPLLLPL